MFVRDSETGWGLSQLDSGKGSLQVCPRWLEDVAMGKLEMASL